VILFLVTVGFNFKFHHTKYIKYAQLLKFFICTFIRANILIKDYRHIIDLDKVFLLMFKYYLFLNDYVTTKFTY